MEEAEAQELAARLARLEPGRLPLPVFLEVCRLTVTPILEVVPLRRSASGDPEVLLLEREPSDPVWPGMLHTPGTVLRASDQEGSYADAFTRVLAGELRGVRTSEPAFVRNLLHRVKRGMETAAIYYVEVLEEPPVGRFYPASGLPQNLVDSQIGFIGAAVARFMASWG